jgi:hypothetical protein
VASIVISEEGWTHVFTAGSPWLSFRPIALFSGFGIFPIRVLNAQWFPVPSFAINAVTPQVNHYTRN